jgi:hypothetical protein
MRSDWPPRRYDKSDRWKPADSHATLPVEPPPEIADFLLSRRNPHMPPPISYDTPPRGYDVPPKSSVSPPKSYDHTHKVLMYLLFYSHEL